jgi:hypothetical protein
MILFGRPIQLAHGYLARIHDVQQLHRDGTIAGLLDFSTVQRGKQ